MLPRHASILKGPAGTGGGGLGRRLRIRDEGGGVEDPRGEVGAAVDLHASERLLRRHLAHVLAVVLAARAAPPVAAREAHREGRRPGGHGKGDDVAAPDDERAPERERRARAEVAVNPEGAALVHQTVIEPVRAPLAPAQNRQPDLRRPAVEVVEEPLLAGVRPAERHGERHYLAGPRHDERAPARARSALVAGHLPDRLAP